MTNESKVRELLASGANREELQSAIAVLVVTDALKALREVDMKHHDYIETAGKAQVAVNELRVAVSPWLWGGDDDELGDLLTELSNAFDAFESSYVGDFINHDWDTATLQSAIDAAVESMEDDEEVRVSLSGHVTIDEPMVVAAAHATEAE